ncbi:uncharacterized protein isoform X2 [Rhodnius prolixus]
MARLINTDKSAMNQSETTETKKSCRKISFKTRGGGTNSARNYRTTKVSVSSSSVAVLASKFNAIIVEDENKGRAILKNLRTNKSNGAVREVVQKFENFTDKPKLVLVRKNSQNRERPLLKVKRITQTVPEEECIPDEETNNKQAEEDAKANAEYVKKPKVQPKPLMRDKKLFTTITKHPTKVKTRDLYKLEGKDVAVKDKKLSIPKNHILESVLNESVVNNTDLNEKRQIKPNNSFLWGPRESVYESKEIINEKSDEIKADDKTRISTVDTNKENLKSNELECPIVRNVDKVGYGKINSKTTEAEEELNRTNLKANTSSLYKHIINNTKNELNKVLNQVDNVKEENVNQEKTVNNNNNLNIHAKPPQSFLHRVASVTASECSYEDITNYIVNRDDTTSEQNNYEIVENFENNYDVINDYDLDEAIYDDVLNVNNSERIYESIYNVSQSHNDSDSSFEHNNSLYEMRPPSQASSASGAMASGASRSDTSDDWVDIEDSTEDQKEEILILEEKFKARTPGWSKKVRRQWSARGVNQYRQGESDNNSGKHYEAVENPDDDSALCDDFDDSSESELSVDHNYKPVENGNMRQDVTESQHEGIYGFMRQARQKMRKMSSIGKRLRRISGITMAVPVPIVAQEIVNGSNENINRGRWPSFKKKNARSNSTFYLNNDLTAELPRVPPIVLPSKNVSNVDVRRLSTSIRPTSPPPPPPPPPSLNGEMKSKPINDTSLYMECGLFEHSSIPSERPRSINSGCWYSDVGLYENKKCSDSASEHDSSQGSDLDLRFADEPLYQFYAERVAELELVDGNSECGYEEIGLLANERKTLQSRPPALDLVTQELQRTLWCQVPQVIQSGVLDTLSPELRKLQEAKFELITSEASYYKSLTILEKHFAASSSFKDETIISKVDYTTLFGNVTAVRKCSEAVLAALEKCWQESILLEGVCDVVCQLAQDRFNSYVKYCKDQSAKEKTLKNLKKNNVFVEALNVLESSPKCHHLTLSSFLLLPMQRITRMPLLQDAILTKLSNNDSEYESCKLALTKLNSIANECNEAARQTERWEEMALLSQVISFPSTLRPLPLLSASRWLVRSGPVTHINLDAKLTFSRKLTAPRNPKLMLFLFTDYLVVTKKKGEDNYSVITYCPRNLVQMTKMDEAISNRFLILLTLLENHELKTQEMVLGCGSESSRERWLQPFTPISSSNPDERLYEVWDCPQVSAMHSYASTQPDELPLQQGDVVNVLRKLSDGWYYGERIRDGVKGWFPGNHTVEIASAHVRARNLKQRHRFLELSSTFIQQQQMNKAGS